MVDLYEPNDLVLASSGADAAAAEAVEEHHAQMAGALGLAVERLVATVARGEGAGRERADLVRWCRLELVPHALAEEDAMYPAARDKVEGRLLVEGMLAEHRAIVGLVEELAEAPDDVRAAAAARALESLFQEHLAKENRLVLPLLVAAPDVSVAELLAGMHELLGGAGDDHHAHAAEEPAGAGGCGGHSCSCGEVDGPGYPELDARAVPHAIRHATIFGALDAVRPGGGLVLVAPHDPLPLLAQVEQRAPGAFDVSYLERGPEAWRLQLVRRDVA
jgi:uncharacterized protein (DUF2249 family)